MSPLYGALTLNIAYLWFRWLSQYFHWVGPGDFLWRMPVFPLLIAFPFIQFLVVRRRMQQIQNGAVIENPSLFVWYKEAAKTGLLTAVFVSGSIWLYYTYIDRTYLPSSIISAIAEAIKSGMPAEQMKTYAETLKLFNQTNSRAVFTLSGLTVFGMLSAWPAALLALKFKK
jgi:hypothetical protein